MMVQGELNLRGVSCCIEVPPNAMLKGDKVSVLSKFTVKPGGHKIQIPPAVREKVAIEIEVTVNTD
jgi:hypothetical protein